MVDVFRLIQFSSATVRVGMSRALFQRARNREKKKNQPPAFDSLCTEIARLHVPS